MCQERTALPQAGRTGRILADNALGALQLAYPTATTSTRESHTLIHEAAEMRTVGRENMGRGEMMMVIERKSDMVVNESTIETRVDPMMTNGRVQDLIVNPGKGRDGRVGQGRQLRRVDGMIIASGIEIRDVTIVDSFRVLSDIALERMRRGCTIYPSGAVGLPSPSSRVRACLPLAG